MTRHFFISTVLMINLSIFAQKGSSSFSDGKYTLGGESVTNAEYERFKESLDDHYLGNPTIVRSSSRDDEFDIHINFDELETGCYWGGHVYPQDLYQDLGIVFSNNGAVIDECGNFGVSGHSSPKFLGFKSTDSLSGFFIISPLCLNVSLGVEANCFKKDNPSLNLR